jgi:uncharacterized protein (TIGR03437 family)
MYQKRFLTQILVVLALALWAGTANAQTTLEVGANSTQDLYYVVPTAAQIAAANGGLTGTAALEPQLSCTINIVLPAAPGTADAVTYAAVDNKPSWLATTPIASPGSIDVSNDPVALTFTVSVPDANLLLPYNYYFHFTVSDSAGSRPLAIALHVLPSVFNVISPAVLTEVTPGTTDTASVNMSLVPGVTAVTYGSSPVYFTLDTHTVPLWILNSSISVSGVPGFSSGTGVASSNNTTAPSVALVLDPTVVATLNTGTTTQSIGFVITDSSGNPSPTNLFGVSEVYVPISVYKANTVPTLALVEGINGQTISHNWSTLPIPVPVVTPFSSNESIPFSISCAITAAGGPSTVDLSNTGKSCTPSAASGLATTLGTPVYFPTLDAALFTNAKLGNFVEVTITVTPTVVGGVNTPIVINYKYTLTPIPAAVTTASPSSVAPLASSTESMVIVLKGTGFVGPGDVTTAISSTKVFFGTIPAPSTNYVVVNSTTLEVTVPGSYLFIPAGSTTSTLALGVANQSGNNAPSAPTSTYNVSITNGPVVYGVFSTATYLQPAVGSNPVVAPYELISIFGANFVPVVPGQTSTGINATLNSYNKVPTSLTISGSGTNAATLTVTFATGTGKTAANVLAPILFANATQINAIVPSGLAVGATATVTVNSAGTPSDGTFAVTLVTAAPGIFTMASDGVGQGAIEQIHTSGNTVTTSVNGSKNGASVYAASGGDTLVIYLTGLGTPDSIAADAATNKSTLYPGACIAISGAKATPGYLQVVNTTTKSPVYTAPSPVWANIDGAVLQSSMILGGLPPCMQSQVTVTIGTGASLVALTDAVSYAGFVSGSVAGLYQINVTLPSPLPTGWATTTQQIQVSIGNTASTTFTSPVSTALVQF